MDAYLASVFLYGTILLFAGAIQATSLAQLPFRSNALDSSNLSLISPRSYEYINGLIEKWNSSGLSVAVVRKDPGCVSGWKIEYGSFGVADRHGTPPTPDTVFAIASNSKLFLSVSIGLLISNDSLAKDRGKEIKWTTRVKDLIPEWALWDDDAGESATVQDLLSHRTGMPTHDFSGVARGGGVREMISLLRYLRPSAEFREIFQYNNLMYETLSYLPQALLNQSYESYVAEHIFVPLNMTATTFSIAEAEARGTLATGFMWDMRDLTKAINGSKLPQVPYFFRPGEEQMWAGAGGILTSARDLATWMAMLLNNGRHPYTNATIIPAQIIEHVALGRVVTDGNPLYPETSVQVYGSGQWRYSYQGHDVVEHGGSNPGFKTQVARFPNDNLAIATLSNDVSGSFIVEAAKWRIAEELLGLKEVDWNGRHEQELRKYFEAVQLLTPRPNPPVMPDQPISYLAEKTFTHHAYGSLHPCLVPQSSLSGSLQGNTFTQSEYCTSVLGSTATQRILAVSDLSIPTFIISWKRTFATHLRLTHFSGNLFNVTTIWTNAEVREREGYGSEGGDLVTGLDEHYEVEWLISDGEEGLAFKSGFWGTAPGSEVTGPVGKGKGGAEVWFALKEPTSWYDH